MIYGIIAALDEEVRLLLEHCKITRQQKIYGMDFYQGTLEGKEVALCKCGIGTIKAALCTSILIRELGAGTVINTGIAGALGEGVRTLDVVLSTEAVYHDVETAVFEEYYPFTTCFKADEALVGRAQAAADGLTLEDGKPVRVHTGRIATGDWFISSKKKKDELVSVYGALCAEMEGAAVANVAYMNDCPFVIIRTMSDSADENAQDTYDDLIDQASNISASILIRMLASC